MKTTVIPAVLAALAFGCVTTPNGVRELTVVEAVTMVSAGSATFYDANGPSTREQFGTVPGAVLLSSYRDYDLSTLPQDKASAVVFYCSSTRCSAAPKAAGRAVEAGYTNVAFMPKGIRGWIAAGNPVNEFSEGG